MLVVSSILFIAKIDRIRKLRTIPHFPVFQLITQLYKLFSNPRAKRISRIEYIAAIGMQGDIFMERVKIQQGKKRLMEAPVAKRNKFIIMVDTEIFPDPVVCNH